MGNQETKLYEIVKGLSDYKTDIYATFQMRHIVPDYKVLHEKSIIDHFKNISMIMECCNGNFQRRFSMFIVDNKVFSPENSDVLLS